VSARSGARHTTATSLRVALLLLLPLTASLTAQATWTVDSAGGAQFTAIQPAILAAAPGDRIEVQGLGPYAGFVVDRGVDVRCVSPVAGTTTGTIEVVGVPAGQRAQVFGFVVDQTANGRVSVRSCAGNVLLAYIGFWGLAAAPIPAQPALEVVDSPCVLVDTCAFRGHDDTALGAPGARLLNSRVTFLTTTVHGGVRRSTSPLVGDSGCTGIELLTGHVNLRGTVVRGGASTAGTALGGNGGDALMVGNGVALALGGCQLRGAPGSSGALGAGRAGWSARGNVRHTNDTLLVGPAPTAGAIADRPVVSGPGAVLVGTNVTWNVGGAPGMAVWLGLDLDFTYDPAAVADSVLVLTPGAVLLAPLRLGALGTATHTVPVPNVPALRYVELFAQTAAITGGAVVLGAPTVTRTQ
jgi:hypothetical protein